MSETIPKPNGIRSQIHNTTDDAPSDLAAAVDALLDDLTSKFHNVSTEIMAKMDEMSRRLDSLEASIQTKDTGSGD
ncbi:hypothetical protein MMC09_003174 [Bachmanniomyces sp. S44760]|nr:hypothetical protein [Bachmanniomyces sp. S44760]